MIATLYGDGRHVFFVLVNNIMFYEIKASICFFLQEAQSNDQIINLLLVETSQEIGLLYEEEIRITVRTFYLSQILRYSLILISRMSVIS